MEAYEAPADPTIAAFRRHVKLLVIILNYRVVELTIECLRSLSREIPRIPGARVAVCENGTGDDSEARLRGVIDANGWQSWVDLSAIHPNRGFTGGNNVVLRAALAAPDPPEYVLLLNADTIVLPHALEALVDFMERHPQVGIAGSRLEGPDGQLQASAFRFFSVASEFDRGLRLGVVSRALKRWGTVLPTPTEPQKVDWVSGASVIIRRAVFGAIGLLDEGFYTYFDDIDFCLNAQRAGWSTYCVPASRVIHLEGASTEIARRVIRRRPDYWFQARRRFYLKNHGRFGAALADGAFLVGYALWRLRRRIQRKPDSDPPHFLWDAFRHSVFVAGFALRDVENPALRLSSPEVASATGKG
jgi:GT2 family glycosyltransferase